MQGWAWPCVLGMPSSQGFPLQKTLQLSQDQCCMGIRNCSKPLQVIRVILKVHNYGLKKKQIERF